MDTHADKRFRVTARLEISAIFQAGRRNGDGLLTVIAKPNDIQPARTRSMVAVSKKHGNAVQRNRIKRLCREAFRQTRNELPVGWDFAIIPRPGSNFTLEAIQGSIRKLTARATKEAGQ